MNEGDQPMPTTRGSKRDAVQDVFGAKGKSPPMSDAVQEILLDAYMPLIEDIVRSICEKDDVLSKRLKPKTGGAG
jgi:hypothetical protein